MRNKRSVPAGMVVLLGVVAILALLVPALRAQRSSATTGTPPWEPDANSAAPYGNLAFYDSTGAAVTSGTNLDHLFDYVEASTPSPNAGATKATLYFAAPNHANPTGAWALQPVSASNPWPNSSAPGTLKDDATNPLDTLGPNDANLTAALGALALDSTDGYANLIEVRMKDSGPLGVTSGSHYWSTDIAYNQTSAATTVDGVTVPANGWAQVYPTSTTITLGTTTTSTSTTTTTTASTTTTTTDSGTTTTTTDSTATQTTTALTSDTTPSSVVGQQVTYTATVTASGSGTATPTGAVTFNDGTTAICTSVALSSSGTATCQQTPTTAATHTISAVYTPADGTFATSTSQNLSQVVDPAQTTVTVTSSQNPASTGVMVTFTATVSVTKPGSGTPTGTVNFSDGTGGPATSCTNEKLTNGAATCAITYTTPTAAKVSSSALEDHTSAAGGPDQVSATYSGDGNFAGSTTSSPLAETVQAGNALPGAPQNVLATAGDGQVVLTWSAPTSNASSVTGYKVFQATTAGGEGTTPVNSTPITGNTYTVTGLTDGTKYYFTVVAVSAAGASAASTEVSATPTASSGTTATNSSTNTTTSTPALAQSTSADPGSQTAAGGASQQSGSLPYTGAATTATLAVALLMVGFGAFLVVAARNRRKTQGR